MKVSSQVSKNDFLVLFGDCRVTKGAKRALIVDTGRGKAYVIDNDASEMLDLCHSYPLGQVLEKYEKEEQEGAMQFVKFLLSKDLCFFTKNPENFPKVPEDWDTYSKVSNAIVDVAEIQHDFGVIIPQLTVLGCYDLQVRFYNEVPNEYLLSLLEQVNKSALKSVELYLKSTPGYTKKFLREITHDYFKIKNVVVHSHKINEAYIIYPEKFRNNMGNIIFIKQNITNETHCGAVSPNYFGYENMGLLNEGKKFNNCLNRKIAIDSKGFIKNCPSMIENYGHIETTHLNKALNQSGFKKYWSITKNQIDICKDCEYRDVCVDCRAYTQDSAKLGKPAKCNYDPYSGEWKEELEVNMVNEHTSN